MRRQGQWLYFACWGVVLLLGVSFVRFGVEAATRPSDGFAAYYTAARLVREGANVSRFYDDAWFRMQVARDHAAARDIYNVNPPTTALLLLPLAGLDYTGARIIWTLFNLLCLIGVGGWLLWRLDLRGAYVPGCAALALLYQPLHANFHLGQVYVLLFGLLVLAWHGYRQQNAPLLGLGLGLMLVLKTACAALWLLLAIQRRWQALGWAAAIVLLVAVSSLPWLGGEAWRTYLVLLAEFNAQPSLAVTAYQSQNSLWRHLFSFDAQWNPAPLISAPALAFWLPWLNMSLLLVVSAYRVRMSSEERDKGESQPRTRPCRPALHADMNFAAFVILSVVLSPVSLDYHYTFVLMPIGLLLASVHDQPNPWIQLTLAVAVYLIAADLPYRAAQIQIGAWALLAYPKLYGALALWGLTLSNGLALPSHHSIRM